MDTRRAASTATAKPGSSIPHAGAEAVRFTYTQGDARRKFESWVSSNTPFTKPPAITSIRSFYLPFWVFVANLDAPSSGLRRREVQGPTLQVYAGDEFPRRSLEVVKVPLLFARPFSPDMLDGAGSATPVEVEPYALYEATAWQLARATHLEHEKELRGGEVNLSDAVFSGVVSHRVLLPAHVVEYKYLTQTFRVYISGATGVAFGVQQQAVFGKVGVMIDGKELAVTLGKMLKALDLPPQAIAVLVNTAVIFLRPLAKFLLWPPFFLTALAAVGGFAITRGTAGLRQERATFAEWQETRKAERRAQAAMTDEWVFRPLGRSDTDRSRERKLEDEGEAKPSQSRASTTSSGTTAGSTRGGAGASTSPPPPRDQGPTVGGRLRSPPPVDPQDYYAVLGLADVNVAATTADIQSAFRRELMKYHPDHQQHSGLDPAACSDRTRIIIAAYGVLRDTNKRATYNASYRTSRARGR